MLRAKREKLLSTPAVAPPIPAFSNAKPASRRKYSTAAVAVAVDEVREVAKVARARNLPNPHVPRTSATGHAMAGLGVSFRLRYEEQTIRYGEQTDRH